MHAFFKDARASVTPAELTGDAAEMRRAQNCYLAFKFEKNKIKLGIENSDY